MDKLAKLTTDIGKLWETYSGAYFTGIRNTLVLAVVATLIGCVIGLLCGILNTIPYTRQDPPVKRFFLKLLRALIRIYVEVFRGTPMVLQAVFIFYGLPYFTDGAVAFKGMGGIWVAAIIVVSINTGAYMAESVRGGIISIDPGQTEGAKAIGMTHVHTIFAHFHYRKLGSDHIFVQEIVILVSHTDCTIQITPRTQLRIIHYQILYRVIALVKIGNGQVTLVIHTLI